MADPAQAAYRSADIRTVEARAAQSHDLVSSELMDRAGRAAFDALRARWPDARRITVLAGPGNNGGDGRVIARLAAAEGISIQLLQPTTGRNALPDGDVIVDALFGIGLKRQPTGDFAAAIEAVNAHGAPVLAVDVPSGLDADEGTAPGVFVCADLTVSFIAYKRGMFTALGPRACGEIVLADLGVSPEAFEGLEPAARVIHRGLAPRLLGRRPPDAHKGAHGHVLVIGGRVGMAGAARLAAEAALRCGAGLVSVACAPGAAAMVGVGRPELMVHEVAGAGALGALLERATVVAIGPGLGTDAWAQGMTSAVFRTASPLVVDADALNLLAASPFPRADWVLTPHPGEAARLIRSDAARVQADRYAATATLVRETNGVVVLKGACTQVGAPDRTLQVCTAGNAGMASGGMGDVLTGVIAGLAAQGLALPDAAAAGVQLHAEAGDAVAARHGPRGIVASDLFDGLQRGVNA